MTGLPDFPGATAVSRLRVYDWPTVDGLAGGSPHLHTASAEGYVVLDGEGSVQTLSGAGYAEQPLRPGTVLWFTPGTVHRLVTGKRGLDILVVMQNAGLPEAGDAVFTFPPEVLADPAAYTRAATLPRTDPDDPDADDPEADDPEADDTGADDPAVAAAARARRDLAIDGFLALRARTVAGGPAALDPLYRAAAAIVRDRAERWQDLWRDGALAQTRRTGEHLAALVEGRGDHLHASTVRAADAAFGPRRYGMCGRLQVWP